MKARVDFVSAKDIAEFTQIVKTLDCDVRLVGKDENGNDWNISAKSLLASLIISSKLQDREHTAHEVDWNTLYCECAQDIYMLIKKFVKIEPPKDENYFCGGD